MDNIKYESLILQMPEARGGVYAILNPVTKKVYVGETEDFYRRMAEHICNIFINESSGKKGVAAENCKTFDAFPVILAQYEKKSDHVEDWIAHETAVMYVFRKAGFTLYNGNEHYRDNEGYKRSFLMQENACIETMRVKTEEYLSTSGFNMPQNYESWNQFFKSIEEELNNMIFRMYRVTSLRKLWIDGCNLWKKRIDCLLSSEKDIRIVKPNNAKKVCRELFNRGLAVEDLKAAGLSPMTVEELCGLINEGKFGRSIISKFGHYLDQGPLTILSSKKYDITKNTMDALPLEFSVNESRKKEGLCFWAMRRLNAKCASNFLSCNGTIKEPVYIIMPYAPSSKYKYRPFGAIEYDLNRQNGETMDEFLNRIKNNKTPNYSFCFALDHNKENKRYNLPERMFPIVMEGAEKIDALVISEIFYLDAGYDNLDMLYKSFYSYTRGDIKEEAAYSFGIKNTVSLNWEVKNGEKYHPISKGKSPVSHMRVSLKEEKKEDIIQFLKNKTKADKENSSLLIARLEYPYVIALYKNS